MVYLDRLYYGRHIENLKTPVQAVFIQLTVTCIVFMPKYNDGMALL